MGLNSKYKGKWTLIAMEQKGEITMRKHQASGILPRLTDSTGFLLKAGQGAQISPVG